MNDVKLCVFGHLGADPVMTYMPSGKAVTNFSMAASRKWKTEQGQDMEETTWVRVSSFGKAAETLNQFLKKGSLVYVEGRLNCEPKSGGPRLWTRTDGSVGASYEIVCENFRFLSSNKSAGGAEDSAEGGADAPVDEQSQAPTPAFAGANTDSDGFPL
jgi:single-strand DNA-binding protein